MPLYSKHDLEIYDENVHEMFFDSNCMNVSPSQLHKELPSKNSDQLSILNLNIRSFTKKFSLLLSMLKSCKNQFTLIVIAETWLKDEHNGLFNIPGYDHININRKGSLTGGGIRIYISRSIKLISIDNELTGMYNSHESLCCELDIGNKTKEQLISIYRPPKGNINLFNEFVQNKVANSHFTHFN